MVWSFCSVHAKVHLAESLDALKAARSRLLVKRLDETIQEQRNVEQEALTYSKNVNSLYQRATKWKAEQKRFRSTLDVRLQCNCIVLDCTDRSLFLFAGTGSLCGMGSSHRKRPASHCWQLGICVCCTGKRATRSSKWRICTSTRVHVMTTSSASFGS